MNCIAQAAVLIGGGAFALFAFLFLAECINDSRWWRQRLRK